MRIMFDLDGVIYDWAKAVREEVLIQGHPDPGESLSWDHYENTIDPDMWDWVWRDDNQAGIYGRHDMLYPGMQEIVSELCDCHTVSFVTHRPRWAACDTAGMIARCGWEFEAIHVLDGWRKDLLSPQYDAYVEDRPKTLMQLASGTTGRVFAPRRFWNQPPESPDLPGVTYYVKPTELFEHIETMEREYVAAS